MATLILVSFPPAMGSSSIETEILNLINSGRSSYLMDHSGLRIVARGHSTDMSRDEELNHDGAAERIQDAPPDPAESNGSPDDGFTGTWCENVAFVRGAPAQEVARRVYEGWTNSPSHNRCMNDDRMNAAGVGVYFDGDDTYWATYESAVDQTAPGSPPTVTPTPEPTPTPTSTPSPVPTVSVAPTSAPASEAPPMLRTEPPERTEPPAPTPQAQAQATPFLEIGVSSSRALAGPATPSSGQRTFGWAEFGATMGLLVVIAETLRRLSRRRDVS